MTASHQNSVLTFEDIRLTRVMQREPERFATVNEYAAATGMTVERILELLAGPLGVGELDVEAVGGEIFVHTAPHGRPVPSDRRSVPANMWERLRTVHDQEAAYTLWRVSRDLQANGWNVETDPMRTPRIGTHSALLGLQVGRNIVPILLLPGRDDLGNPAGVLSKVEASGMKLCAVTCLHRELDATITAVRRWMLLRQEPILDLLILEAPRYSPVLLSCDDGGLTPRDHVHLLQTDEPAAAQSPEPAGAPDTGSPSVDAETKRRRFGRR